VRTRYKLLGMGLAEMRRVRPFLVGVPFELVPAQDQPVAMLIEYLNKARLNLRGCRTQMAVKTDAGFGTPLSTSCPFTSTVPCQGRST
jgi:hypothetical protein